MKVKICGVCRPEDALLVAGAGADYIGVILAKRGPRHRSVLEAERIFDAAGALMRVGVFADQPLDELVQGCETLKLDVIQLHGGENAEYVADAQRRTNCSVWKSISVDRIDDIERQIEGYADVANGLLLDSGGGGTGRRFDWQAARAVREMIPPNVSLILAGGLSADTVREAIETLGPDIVDVASGVEAKICEKSSVLVEAFIKNAKS